MNDFSSTRSPPLLFFQPYLFAPYPSIALPTIATYTRITYIHERALKSREREKKAQNAQSKLPTYEYLPKYKQALRDENAPSPASRREKDPHPQCMVPKVLYNNPVLLDMLWVDDAFVFWRNETS